MKKDIFGLNTVFVSSNNSESTIIRYFYIDCYHGVMFVFKRCGVNIGTNKNISRVFRNFSNHDKIFNGDIKHQVFERANTLFIHPAMRKSAKSIVCFELNPGTGIRKDTDLIIHD